jgi:hypothetical protein
MDDRDVLVPWHEETDLEEIDPVSGWADIHDEPVVDLPLLDSMAKGVQDVRLLDAVFEGRVQDDRLVHTANICWIRTCDKGFGARTATD